MLRELINPFVRYGDNKKNKKEESGTTVSYVNICIAKVAISVSFFCLIEQSGTRRENDAEGDDAAAFESLLMILSWKHFGDLIRVGNR